MSQHLRNTQGLALKDMAYTSNPHMPRVRRDAARLVRKGWSMQKVARRLGVNPGTISRWCALAEKVGDVPIRTRPSAPKTHPNALPKEVVKAIVAKRIGSRRCGQVIHQELLRDGIEISLPSVQRTLSRLNLLKKRSPWKRSHDSTERPKATRPGALLQADTVHIMLPDGSRLYIYTLIDLYSRWAYAEVAPKIGARISFSFLMRAHRAAPFAFEMVQTDNGGEFQKMFRYPLAKRGIHHRYARVRQSNDQAHIERFNRTIQEECLDLTPHTLKDFKRALKQYLQHYNGKRLHMGINYQTPLEVLRRC